MCWYPRNIGRLATSSKQLHNHHLVFRRGFNWPGDNNKAATKQATCRPSFSSGENQTFSCFYLLVLLHVPEQKLRSAKPTVWHSAAMAWIKSMLKLESALRAPIRSVKSAVQNMGNLKCFSAGSSDPATMGHPQN